MKHLSRLALLAALILNASCVVHKLKVNRPGDSFSGLAQTLAGGEDVCVFVTHGMGINFMEFADPVINASTQQLGFVASDTAWDTSGPGFLKTLTFDKEGQTLKFYIHGWYPATWEKWVLDWIDSNPDRLPTMDNFKANLMNQSIADVIMYQGTRRGEIKEGVEYTLQKMVEDNESASYVAITESLGSKIFVETLNDNIGRRTAWSSQFQSSLRSIYMLSNQLPLLFLGDMDETPEMEEELVRNEKNRDQQLRIERNALSISQQTMLLNKAYLPLREYTQFGDRSEDKIQMVAFSDPNDLLSYQVPNDAVYSRNYTLVNVNLSIAEKGFSIPFKKPEVVNPLAAHLNYQENKQLVKYLVNGYLAD